MILPFNFGDESINAGDVTSIQCTVVKGDSPISIVWLFNDTEITNSDTILINKNSKRVSALTIESVRADNTGAYTCLARNSAGAANHTAYLHVNGNIIRNKI
jgi:hypothetical protein